MPVCLLDLLTLYSSRSAHNNQRCTMYKHCNCIFSYFTVLFCLKHTNAHRTHTCLTVYFYFSSQPVFASCLASLLSCFSVWFTINSRRLCQWCVKYVYAPLHTLIFVSKYLNSESVWDPNPFLLWFVLAIWIYPF